MNENSSLQWPLITGQWLHCYRKWGTSGKSSIRAEGVLRVMWVLFVEGVLRLSPSDRMFVLCAVASSDSIGFSCCLSHYLWRFWCQWVDGNKESLHWSQSSDLVPTLVLLAHSAQKWCESTREECLLESEAVVALRSRSWVTTAVRSLLMPVKSVPMMASIPATASPTAWPTAWQTAWPTASPTASPMASPTASPAVWSVTGTTRW